MKIDKEARDKIIERLNECDELGGYTVETAKVLSPLEDFINSIPVDDSPLTLQELKGYCTREKNKGCNECEIAKAKHDINCLFDVAPCYLDIDAITEIVRKNK